VVQVQIKPDDQVIADLGGLGVAVAIALQSGSRGPQVRRLDDP
jgi:hypothetical protein